MKKYKLILAVVCSLFLINSSNAQKLEKHESFNVKISGKGAPIFFIPGILCSADVWDETIKHYEKNYTCYAFTLAGFAEASPLQQGTEIMPKIKSDLIAYIKSHSNKNAILIGHSMGGFYGLMIASSEPTLLKKLVVVDALPFLMAAQDSTRSEEQIRGMLVGAENTYLKTEESVLKNQQLAILRTMITNEAQIEKACTWSMRSDRYTMGKTFAEMMGTDLRDDVKNINTNTLVMVAWDKPIAAFPDYTKEASYKVYAQQYKNLKGVQLKQTDGAKHFIMYDQPEWFINTLDEFIR
jgi:pimeloyl-ACP methyl ester carboxylesterase